MADEKTIPVPEADLGLILDYCARHPTTSAPRYRDALDRTVEVWRAWHEAAFAEMTAPEPEPLPDGIFGRIELPGYRNHTGWITDELRFGQQVAVVRDWDRCEVAMVVLGPGCQIVALPTPLKRPDPAPPAITSGRWDGREDLVDDDLDDGYDRDFTGPVL